MTEAPVVRIDAAPARPRFAALPPLSLYVHIPWCVRKCPYCDFNSHEAKGDVPEDQYVDALLTDLEIALPSVWGRRIFSVFIGGGTPSLFTAAAIDRLLSGIRARTPLAPDAEITLEANPGTVEAARFRPCRSTSIFHGAYASARIATSTRTRRKPTYRRISTSTLC